GGSLSRELPKGLLNCEAESQATVQALVYGSLRYFERIEFILKKLLRKPLKKRDRIVADLLRIALFELMEEVTPDYAVVDGTVKSVAGERSWAKGLANAVLRRFIRERSALLKAANSNQIATALLPEWMLQKIQVVYPKCWESIAASLNQAAPMILRINLDRVSRQDYLQHLREAGIDATPIPKLASAIALTSPTDVTTLPGFAEGWVSVQDAAAQQAAFLLDSQRGDHVLDACAAPGGKTVHILESARGDLKVTAVESDARRTQRLDDNLQRSGYKAEVKVADVAKLDDWWDGQLFDRILLDAPCSASGVIRRHPDIKRHRRSEDIPPLVAQQARLLEAVWQTLKPGGRLLYATCTIFPEENSKQIGAFLLEHRDAEELLIDQHWGLSCEHGKQILPGEDGMDGFYYASLTKTTT
ncbi:MAG: 16S rRNA (cytosine(967)-C(5))-methyltransferase RsmB, partial [Methylococcales bacterium]|nr:16S rRNA (cytosine(967)-C(5))-methyltransferase RsmB [Methylococcales bacterium]